MEPIDLFIWGFQRHFQISVQCAAAKLFGALDPEIEPQIMLLGLRREGTPSQHPVCLEPDDCGWAPSDFDKVRGDSDRFLENDGQENVMTTNARHYDSIQRRRRADANEAAVLAALKRSSPQNVAEDYYFSGLLPVDDYDVGIVLRLRFGKRRPYIIPQVHGWDQMRIPGSLVEAAANCLLGDALRALYVPAPASVEEYYGKDSDEILRKAASSLMLMPVFAAGGVDGLYGLYDACNYIASLNYEGAESKGGMLLADAAHPNIQFLYRLLKPVSLGRHRAIRKLLEVTKTGASLITDGDQVQGVGRMIGKYDEQRSDLLQLRFTGHHKWELLHGENCLMRVAYGVPTLPRPALDEKRFSEAFEIVFSEPSRFKARKLYDLALEACLQRKGTIMIFSPKASEESVRLANQSTPIEPLLLSVQHIRDLTAIDGALLVDLDGVCHSIGTILDGEATSAGDPGRGARFNSCIRYLTSLENRDIPAIAIIVSEDGSTEMIPELPPRIRKGTLLAIEKEADRLLAGNGVTIHHTQKALRAFDRNRFYLSDELCEKGNQLRAAFKKLLQGKPVIVFMVEKFEPNPDMSDSFIEP